MSKIHLIILNVILLVAVLISSQFIYAETIESNTNITEPDSIALLKPMLPTVDLHKYYDIVPGDERWENLCLSEKLQAQQLKPDILDSIPTSDLLDICLFNPYIANYGCYDNLNEGLESVINTFNMYPVLLSRKDAVSLICNKYIAFNYTKVNNALNTHKLHFINFLSIE
ncbi:MAG TPA: hypothetical protein PLE74_10210, partial [Candidatus Cloacimonadota bacterium]|nr:hypothetical protein [Candidatus Cloacimonadota bacterium]